MRQVLVDCARRRNAGKRAAPKVSLEESVNIGGKQNSDIVAMDSALSKLEKIDRRKCKAIELRYFGGLSMDETARALEVSVITVRRDLRMAEAWLRREISGG